jgi:hypothetical protein
MYLSELIAHEAAILDEYGDIEVFVRHDGDDRFSSINCVDVKPESSTEIQATVSIHID